MIPSLPNNLKYSPTASDMITETSNTEKAEKPVLYSQPILQSQKAYQPCHFFIYEHVSFSTSRKHSCKKGNTQILKALVNICCDWLSKTEVAFPPSKYTCHFLSTHAISLMSTSSYHLLFVLHQEAKGPSSTCQRDCDWRCTNTQLEILRT